MSSALCAHPQLELQNIENIFFILNTLLSEVTQLSPQLHLIVSKFKPPTNFTAYILTRPPYLLLVPPGSCFPRGILQNVSMHLSFPFKLQAQPLVT